MGILAGFAAGLAASLALWMSAPAMAAARFVRVGVGRVVGGLIGVLVCGVFASSAVASGVGVNADITWGISQSDVTHEISLLKAAGVTSVRASVDLSGAEYSGPGQLNSSYLAGIDYAISAARSAGLNVLMEFDRTPYWASADPAKTTDSSGAYHYNHYYKYANTADYAHIVTDLVNRYKAMGVHTYEAWNEPNNSSFWPSGPNAAEYTTLLKAAYPAIKTADPTATVAMAGLMNQGSYEYLQGMYDAGAKGSYDVANFHIYPGDPNQCNTDSSGRQSVNSFCLIDGLRAKMTANADNSPVWITELGWSTCAQSYCVTPTQQASYLTSAFALLNTNRYAYVRNTYIYQIRNNPYVTTTTDWDSSLGLLNLDWTPKPAYTALQLVGTATASDVGSQPNGGTGTTPNTPRIVGGEPRRPQRPPGGDAVEPARASGRAQAPSSSSSPPWPSAPAATARRVPDIQAQLLEPAAAGEQVLPAPDNTSIRTRLLGSAQVHAACPCISTTLDWAAWRAGSCRRCRVAFRSWWAGSRSRFRPAPSWPTPGATSSAAAARPRVGRTSRSTCPLASSVRIGR